MENEHLYSVSVKWKNGRAGVMESPALSDTIQVATPPEFKGGVAGIWSPEHLLVAAVNSCLMTTFLAVAENSGLQFMSFTSNANGKLAKKDGKYMITDITLLPVVTITSESQREKAEKVFQKSEAACLISNSVKAAVVMQPTITVTL